MRKAEIRAAEARREAQVKWDKTRKQEAEATKKKDKEREVVANKISRLRDLRLAKEAADKEAATANPVPKPRRKRASAEPA
ncbi:MAG: hypothetical protein EXQ86_07685 [Rhodospirillales bacterium]|nr:hypothetical protein [Rhodospirillales bacterium]